MRTQTQLKIFFAGVLISLGTFTNVTSPQVLGAGQSKSPAVVTVPQDACESGQGLQSVPPSVGTGERCVESRFPVNRQVAPVSSPRAVSFFPAVTYLSGGLAPVSAAVADVNGDGKLDVVVVNENSNTVGVLLGKGDGTFQGAVTYGSGGLSPLSVVVADVNGDAIPDLVVANGCGTTCASGEVGVLLGNGDGTFQPAVSYGSGGVSPWSVAVADLNLDGKLDVVISNQNDNTLGVLLGNGDGTFQSAVSYGSGSNSFTFTVAIADVNGDGKPDLVVADECDNYPTCAHGTVGVLLGNGDGTFQTATVYFSGGSEATSLAVADVNGDGKLDLIVGNNCFSCGSSTVSVQLGNGDGTFAPAVAYILTLSVTRSVAVADVNGDGKPDLLVAGQIINAGRVGSLLGNGDGSFQSAVLYHSGGSSASSVAVADINGDGKPDLLVANAGNYATTSTVGVLINKTVFTPTTTTLVSSPNPSLVGQAVTFTAMVSSTAGSPPNGEIVTFNNGSAVLGTGSLSAGSASFTTSSLPLGTSTITTSYPGNSTFGASTSPVLKQVVNPNGKSSTSTSLTSSLNPSSYGQRVTWTATVKASGSITPTGNVRFTRGVYTIGSATLNSSGVATLTRSNLNVDTYPLTAVYAGDSANLGSTSAVLNQVVLQATSTATLTSSPNPSTQGQAVTFTAKISSPTVKPTGPVAFTSGKTVLGTAQLSVGKAALTITSLPIGPTSVTVTYYGDSNIAKSSASVIQIVQ